MGKYYSYKQFFIILVIVGLILLAFGLNIFETLKKTNQKTEIQEIKTEQCRIEKNFITTTNCNVTLFFAQQRLSENLPKYIVNYHNNIKKDINDCGPKNATFVCNGMYFEPFYDYEERISLEECRKGGSYEKFITTRDIVIGVETITYGDDCSISVWEITNQERPLNYIDTKYRIELIF